MIGALTMHEPELYDRRGAWWTRTIALALALWLAVIAACWLT